MSNYLKNVWLADFLGAELSFFVLSFITGNFNQTAKIIISFVMLGIFLLRYLFRLKQKIGTKLLEIFITILIIVLSYRVDIRLILIVGLYTLLAVCESSIKDKFIEGSQRILFSLIGYSFLLFLGTRGIVIFLFVLLLHLMIATARELLYFSSLENEANENYVERVKKQFFIARFIIYIFFVYSPMALALKIVRFIPYLVPLFLLIDIPYIMFISYIRISHSNKNFKRITLFISYSIPLFYLILLTGRF
ncbi:MAG: hypothetical protein GWP03_06005 [Proteobacteria bacterium]|nr:hypothetical protein [Pseudomonadota bacterium]